MTRRTLTRSSLRYLLSAYPVWLAITPDGSRVYVPLQNDMAVAVISTSSDTVVASVPTSGAAPIGLAITPDGTRAYVTDQGSGMVSVIDTNPADAGTYNTEIAAVTVGGRPYVPGVTPDGLRVYVANESSSNLSVISTVDNTVTTIPIGAVTYAVGFAPDGSEAYVTTNSGTLSVVDAIPSDASFNTVIATVGVGSVPIGVGSVVVTDVDRFAELNGTNTFTGNETIDGNISATNFVGNGSGLSNVNVSSLGGVPASNYARTDVGNALNGNQTVNGSVTATTFVGDGSNLTGVTAATANFANMANVATTAASATTAAELNNVLASSYARLDIPNIFNGNQSITGGYLELDNTNAAATTGVITMGGTAVFHNYGSQNMFVGENAGNFSLTGNYNSGFGYQALLSNTSGFANTAVGSEALQNNANGFDNTATGYQSLNANTAGGYNTAFGYALIYNTTGSNNTAVGFQAGVNQNGANANTTGSNNTFLGYSAGPQTPNQLTNATAIGSNAVVNASNALVLGSISGLNGASNNVNVGIGTSTPGYSLDVQGGQINASGGLCIAGVCQTSWPSGGGGGTITGVTAGTGLLGGGTSGNVPLSVDESVVAFQSDLTNGVTAAEAFATSAASAAATSSENFASNTFLPLAGGTLTGNVSGTSASFSGTLSAQGGVTANGIVGTSTDPTGVAVRGHNTQGYGIAGTSDSSSAAGGILENTVNGEIVSLRNSSGEVASVDGNGIFHFAAGQTFPGTGAGTITGVTAGTGLSGGGTSGNVSLSIPAAGVTNSMLANSSLTLAAGTGLTGGGPVSLGGNVTLSLASNACSAGNALTALPFTCAPFAGLGPNSFTGNQTVSGIVTATAFSGDGSALTNVNALTAVTANSALTAAAATNASNLNNVPASNYARLDQGNSFNGNQLVSGALTTTAGITASNNTDIVYGYFENNNNTGTADALYALHTGLGNALHAVNTQTNSTTALFESTYSGGSTRGMVATDNSSSGVAGVLQNKAGGEILSLQNASGELANVDGSGIFHFAAGQTFPGTGPGTITSITAGAGLAGGGSSGNVSLNIPIAGVTNSLLANPSLTVAAGPGLTVTGGSPVSLGGTATVSLATNTCAAGSAVTAHPFTCTAFPTFGANTFTGAQTMPNLAVPGQITTFNLNAALVYASATSTGPIVQGLNANGGSGSGVYGSNTTSLPAYAAGVFNNVASANTGNILLGQYNGANEFTVDAKGDVTANGLATVAGALLPSTGTATASQGFKSNALESIASVFNSSAAAAQNQTFLWQAEPKTGTNDTASPSATMNLLFGANGATPSETGLSLNTNGTLNFAAGQTFPGTGAGTITGITAGAGLTGGGSSGNVSLSITSQACATGSAVTAHPFTCTAFPIFGANTFTGTQTMPTLTVSGVGNFQQVIATGSSFTPIGGIASGAANGVAGQAVSGFGVSGSSTSNAGVYGTSGSSFGVEGISNSYVGVFGQSVYSTGVDAYSTSGDGLYALTYTTNTATTAAAGVFNNVQTTNPGNILLGQYQGANEFVVDAKGDVTGNGVAKFASYSVSGTVPTCAFTSGGGTSPTCALDIGSTSSAGIIIATTGTGAPAGTGTITLTFPATFGTDKPVCIYEASDNGTGAWNGLAVMKDKTPSTASDLFTWTNGATPTVLTASRTYYINYHCFAK